MDTLSALLSLHHLRSRIDVRCHLQGQWHLPHQAGALHEIRWHALLAGAARLQMPDGKVHVLPCASLVILPQSAPHHLLHHDENAHLLCGCLQIDTSTRHLLAALPQMLIYHESQPWLLATLRRLHDESLQTRPGQQALCDQLSVILLTLALRHWLETNPAQSGLLAALLHPRLSPAINAMLKQPEQDWTVAGLAEQTHLSRASFARQFRALTGSTPLLSLTEIRMTHAAALISRQSLPLADIAERVGYASESAFHKAFVRHMGLTPGDYRRRVQWANNADVPPTEQQDPAL